MTRHGDKPQRITELAADIAERIEKSGRPARTLDDNELSARLQLLIDELGRSGPAPWEETVHLGTHRRLKVAFDAEQGAEASVEVGKVAREREAGRDALEDLDRAIEGLESIKF